MLFVIALMITSLGAYFAYFAAVHYYDFTEVKGTPITLFQTSTFYLSVFLCVGFIFVWDYFVTAAHKLFKGKKIDVLRNFMIQSPASGVPHQLDHYESQNYMNQVPPENILIQSFYDNLKTERY